MEKKEQRLIDADKLLRDLRGVKDVLVAQGDPFLASVMNRAIECVKNQPTLAYRAPLDDGFTIWEAENG